jgi:hypothetical protein
MFADYIDTRRIAYKEALIKPDWERNSDCIFNHHVHTPYTVIDTFWKNKKFNSFITCNIEALLHKNIQYCANVCFLTSCSTREQLGRKILSKVQEYNKNSQFEIIRYSVDNKKRITGLKEIAMKTFSAGFLNSPYSVSAGNSTNKTSVYPDFTQKILPIIEEQFVTITPRPWVSKPDNAFRKFMFAQPHLKEMVCLKNTAFANAQVNTCYSFFDFKDNNKSTTIYDIDGNSTTICLDENTTIPWGNISWIPVLQKLNKLKGLDTLWKRGSLNLNEVVEDPNGQKFCKAIGTLNGPINYTTISNKETCGLNKKKIGFANVGDNDKIGPIKNLDDDAVAGHSVVIMEVETDEQRNHLRDYIDSPFVKSIMKAIKTSTPNAKYLFEYVPLIDLNSPYNLANIFAQAGLTKEEEKLFESQ